MSRGPYTKEELATRHEMRKAARKEQDRERDAWQAAGVGYTDSSIVYGVEYQKTPGHLWCVASPFFEPPSLRPEETADRNRACMIAQEIKNGLRPVSSGGESMPMHATRVYSRVSCATITDVYE
jgi:hypothetical protein